MFEEVKEVIVEALSCASEKVTLEARLFEDLGADSLDAVELSLALEDKLGVTIAEDALGTLKTVGDIVKYLEENK